MEQGIPTPRFKDRCRACDAYEWMYAVRPGQEPDHCWTCAGAIQAELSRTVDARPDAPAPRAMLVLVAAAG
ncbi:MAG TPA: hypothetical protein VFH53_06400 [Phycisphaerae bacterium]|nr:hypothetical protein [Phycisphaerae bacterium]HUX15094.1 hypothetical protein [Phycisphaerae bacterium]